MEKQIAQIRNKMIGLVLALAALAAWAHDFIIEGIKSHVEVTSAILATFGFGIVMSFVFISKLKPEIIAFKALREMWDDIRVADVEQQKDPFWRHYRCAEPAQIFQRPRLLGHAYDLVTEELARTKKIRISVETMNTLVHKIEQTINAEKSLIVYLSGLLVFMGLIGTFIGLLHMVGSIGGIIGSLAQSASGSATGAFAELLGALQEPLRGMASGFAASLFGLFSSLVVGLLGRLAGQAAGVLKNEFESWLAGVVQIGEDEYGDTTAEATHHSATDTRIVNMMANVLADYSRVASSFDAATRLLQDMRAAQHEHQTTTRHLVAELAAMQSEQARIANHLAISEPIVPALRELSAGVERLGHSVTRRIETDVVGLRDILIEQSRSHAANLRMISANQAEASAQIAGAISLLTAEAERQSPHAANPQIVGEAIERSLRAGLDDLGRSLAVPLSRLETQTAVLADVHSRAIIEASQTSSNAPAGDMNALAHRLEGAMSDGFARMSHSFDAAFTAYSSLLRVALAAMEHKAEPHHGEATPVVAAPGGNAGGRFDQLAADFRNREIRDHYDGREPQRETA